MTFQAPRRIWPDPDLEGPLLHYVAQVWSEKAELLHRDFKPYGLDFSRLQGYALEALQLFDGPGNGAHQIAHVELHYFGAGTLARVLYCRTHNQSAAGADYGGLDIQIAIVEGCVREAEAEWEEG